MTRLDPGPYWECRSPDPEARKVTKLKNKPDFQPFKMAWNLAPLDPGPYWECGSGSRSKKIYQIIK
jgi:hypothetical protein